MYREYSNIKVDHIKIRDEDTGSP